jgi:hypothetical protein
MAIAPIQKKIEDGSMGILKPRRQYSGWAAGSELR